VQRSRFEVELNRSRDQALYRRPEEAWGLPVWRRQPEPEQRRVSQAIHDAFYQEMAGLLRRAGRRTGRFVLLDLHSYCHRRGGPLAAPDCPEQNPEINVGTASIEHARWGHLIARFMEDLRRFDFGGRSLDVRENVKFGGGYFPRWVNHHYGSRGCAIAVEIKKIYLDEWTGAVSMERLRLLQRALRATLPGLMQELQRA